MVTEECFLYNATYKEVEKISHVKKKHMNFANKAWVAGVAALIIGAGLGYWLGNTQGFLRGQKTGYDSGYQKALADTKATQEAVARNATEEAVKAANPFQKQNPLEGVTANPFEQAAKDLNPFAK